MELNIFKRSKQQQHSCFNNFVNKRNKKCNNKNNNYFYIRNSHRHHHRSYIALLISMLFLFNNAATAAILRHRMPVKPLVAATSNPTPSKPSADGVTPDEDVAGTKTQKPVIFGGGSDPLDTTDHSLDVTNEGDPDTMPVTDPDEVKPSEEWMNDQKKLVKRFNSHEKIPRRSQGSHDIFFIGILEFLGIPNESTRLSRNFPEFDSNFYDFPLFLSISDLQNHPKRPQATPGDPESPQMTSWNPKTTKIHSQILII